MDRTRTGRTTEVGLRRDGMPFGALLAAVLLILAPGGAGAFELVDSKGVSHRLADYQGKWVLVNFWATWCPPCLDEIPDLVSLYEARRGRDLQVIGIAVEYQDKAKVLEFAENMFISYPVVLGDARAVSQVGPVRGLPTTFLYDPCGRVAAKQTGPISREDVEKFIARTKSGDKC